MAKERSLLKMIVVNFWNSLKPRNTWGNKIGMDYNGTQYYEIPLNESSRRKRPARWFVPKIEDNFEQDIPPEWEAWLRYRRTEPPTEEEIQLNLEKAQEARRKAAEIEKNYPKSLQDSINSGRKQVTSKNFPIYDDLEGMPGGAIKTNRFQPK